MTNSAPKIFISYSHENAEFEKKVYDFANKLRSDGIDANVDLYEECPAEGWPRWMDNQIRISDYVLVICTKLYYEKALPENNIGKGVSWEVNIVYQYIYDNYSENKKFIPIFFDASDEEYILTPLKAYTFYNISTSAGYDKLYWRLHGVSSYAKPPLGKLKPLPEKEHRTMFFSTPINLELWNKAKWKGMLYLMYPDAPPALGIVFTNYEFGKKIFSEWISDYPAKIVNNYLELTYIKPPFPDDNPIYSDEKRSRGKGYWVHIGPNVDETIKRMNITNSHPKEMFLATLCRYLWVDEVNGSQNREMLKQLFSRFKSFQLIPIGIRNETLPLTEENLIIDFKYALTLSNIKFVAGKDVTDQDIFQCVINYQNHYR